MASEQIIERAWVSVIGFNRLQHFFSRLSRLYREDVLLVNLWNAFDLAGYEHIHDNLLKRNWDWEYYCYCWYWQFLCLVKYIFPKHAHCSWNHHDSETSLLLLRLPQKQARSSPLQDFLNKTNAGMPQARAPGTKVPRLCAGLYAAWVHDSEPWDE